MQKWQIILKEQKIYTFNLKKILKYQRQKLNIKNSCLYLFKMWKILDLNK